MKYALASFVTVGLGALGILVGVWGARRLGYSRRRTSIRWVFGMATAYVLIAGLAIFLVYRAAR